MMRLRDGIVPGYMLYEVARTNPLNNRFATRTIDLTHELFVRAMPGVNPLLVGNHGGQGKTRRPRHSWVGTNAEVKIYDAGGKRSLPGKLVRADGAPATGDKTVDLAHQYHGNVRYFLEKVLKIKGIDAKGMDFVGTVHYGFQYSNAFWDGKQMTYGDGDGIVFVTFVILGVVGHEIMHGVTEFTSGLEYWNESGAANESGSDIGGALVEMLTNNVKSKDFHWLVGPGLFGPTVKGRALRDMMNPGTAYDDPANLGKDPQPNHYSRRYKGGQDNGGVHINSGIMNRAFATFAVNAPNCDFAFDRPFQPWRETLWSPDASKRVGSRANFQQIADKTVANCRAIDPALVDTLRAAWDVVGIAVK